MTLASEIRALKAGVDKARKVAHDRIRAAEATLADLRKQATQLEGMFGTSNGTRPKSRAQRTGSKRLDWVAVLAKLPTQFTAHDVAVASGKNKPSEVFAGITRWRNAKLVKRIERGSYQKAAKPAKKAA